MKKTASDESVAECVGFGETDNASEIAGKSNQRRMGSATHRPGHLKSGSLGLPDSGMSGKHVLPALKAKPKQKGHKPDPS